MDAGDVCVLSNPALSRVTATVREGGFRRVAVQVPTSLLPYADRIVEMVKGELTASNEEGSAPRVYILADTVYGGCCVDTVGAKHYGTDFIIHVGRRCLGQSGSSIPYSCVPWPMGDARSFSIVNLLACVRRNRHVFLERATGNSGESPRVIVVYVDDQVTVEPISVAEAFADCLVGSAASDAEDLCDPLLRVYLAQPISTSHIGPQASTAGDNAGSPVPSADRRDDPFCRYRLIPATKHHSDDSGASALDAVDAASAKAVFVDSGGSLTPKCGLPVDPNLFQILLRLSPRMQVLCVSASRTASSTDGEDTSVPDLRSLVEESNFLLRRFAALSPLMHNMNRTCGIHRVAILCGSVGHTGQTELISLLREQLRAADKTAFVIVVGKLNEAKLTNFPDIECYCVVACPRRTLRLIQDSHRYYQPIVTPFDLQVALGVREWSTEYLLDLMEILISTPTNWRERMRDSGTCKADEVAIQTKFDYDRSIVALESRTFQGVDPSTHGQAPTLAVEGLSGIASGYKHEHVHLK